MKSDWLYCGVIRARLAFQGKIGLGFVVLSREEEISPDRTAALEESARTHALVLDDQSIKAKCFSLDTTRSEAEREGVLAIREAVAMLPLVYSTLKAEVTPVGYVMDFKNGQVYPVVPRRFARASANTWILSAKRREGTPPCFEVGRVLAYKKEFGELGTALRRSCHWRTLAGSAFDVGEELLFRWMAVECLTRADPKEKLTAKFMSALGFPRGRYFECLPEHVRRIFQEEEEITRWNKYVTNLFERMRDVRDSIAHSAYRELEMSTFYGPKDLRIVRRAFEMLVPRLEGLALAGLDLRFRTVSELWEHFGEAYLHQKGSGQSALTDTRGNVISLLKYRDPDDFD